MADHRYSENRYVQEQDVLKYENERYAARDQRYISALESEIIEKQLSLLQAPRGQVLDAPCGYGRFTNALISRGWKPTCVDISPQMVAYTQRKAQQQKGVELRGAEASLTADLPFAAGEFDGAICIRMLHNTLRSEDRVLVMKALGNAVSDWIVLTYYGSPILHRLQFWLRKQLHSKARQTMALVPPAEFKKEVAAAGLVLEKDIAILPGIHAQHVAVLRKK
jgi:SAM-dependent methyltransferase